MRETLILRGQSNNIGFAFIQDSSSTTGAGLTGVTSASGSLNISVRREKSSAMTTYTGANIGAISTLGTWANPGTGKVNIKAVDATNAPGLYELHFEDAIFNTGDTSRKLVGYISGVTNMAPTPFEVPLAAVDPQDGARFGQSSIPNANPGSTGGLVIAGTNSGAISFTGGMTITTTSGDALIITVAGGNGNAIIATGSGTGSGIKSIAGATGHGIYSIGGATSGHGLLSQAGAIGDSIHVVGGSSSGFGIGVTTTSGDGINIQPTAGHGILATANGTSKHGIIITGGTAGTSDGVHISAGTGGVQFRSDITGTVALTSAYDAAKAAAQSGDPMSLTGAALTAIAAAVEGHLIDEADGQQLLTAIVAKINSTDVNLAGLSTATIAAAVWAYLLSNMTTPNSGGSAITMILAQANKIGQNAGDSSNAVTAQTTIATNLNVLNSSILAAAAAGASAASSAASLAGSAASSSATAATNTTDVPGMLEVDPANAGKKRLTVPSLVNAPQGSGGGGSGLNAQQTRDAMMLAPSAGTPAAGSVDAELDAIVSRANQIGSASVTYTGPVASDGSAVIYQGDDNQGGRSLTWTKKNYAGPNLAGATLLARWMTRAAYNKNVNAHASLSVAGSVTTVTETDGSITATFAIPLTAAQTIGLESAPLDDEYNWVAQLVTTTADTLTQTDFLNAVTVRRRVSP